MKRIPFEVEYRDKTGKSYAKKLRKSGKIPGVLYGPGMDGAIPVSVDLKAFGKLMKEAGEGAFLLDLKLKKNGSTEDHVALIKEVQKDIITRQPIHVDFQRVDLSREVTVEVEVVLVGTPKGVERGGILEQERDELEIVCLPMDIPDAIRIDVSHLDIGDSIHVNDIKFEKGRIVADTNFTIATVVAPSGAGEEEAEEEEEEGGESG